MDRENTSYPIVSVVMAVYNRNNVVGRAIESVLVQTLRDFEFIIVDDGSTDGTGKVLQEYAAKDDRIRIITQRNQGMPASRNTGVVMSRGKYIAFVDSDDACATNRLEVQLKILRQNPGFHACGCPFNFINSYKKDPQDNIAKVGKKITYISSPVFQRVGFFLLGPQIFITKKSFLALGGYRVNPEIIEDLDFTLRYSRLFKWIFLRGTKLYFYTSPSGGQGLVSQDIHNFARRHICCYISEWARHNNLADPVEERKTQAEILAILDGIPWWIRYRIFKSMGHLIDEMSIIGEETHRSSMQYLLRQLRFPSWLRLAVISWVYIKRMLRIFVNIITRQG